MNILIREIYDYKKPIVTWRENVKTFHIDETAFRIEIDGKVIPLPTDASIHNVIITKCQYEPQDLEKDLYVGASCEEYSTYESFDDMFTEMLECVGFNDEGYMEIKINNASKYIMIIMRQPDYCRIINNIDDYLVAEASGVAESEREDFMNESRKFLRIAQHM